MANNLTGDYEAVLQMKVRQINAILATMHQSRIDPAASPTFPHSASIRVGDLPVVLGLEAVRFRNWVSGALEAIHATTGAAISPRPAFSGSTPPGVATFYEAAWGSVDATRFETVHAGTIRGRADVQLSAPKISIPPGSVSQVTVHVYVRANYVHDPGTGLLPAPIHGEVRALYIATAETLPNGQQVLHVQLSPHDNQIQFSADPGTGLGAADVNQISTHLRNALRKDFAPLDVKLPAGFPFSEFKGLGSGPGEAVVLPLQLSGAPFPAGGLAAVNSDFLAASEFAVAVSREYVQAFFGAIIASIKAYTAALDINYRSAIFGTAHYTVSANVSVDWKATSIEVSGTINFVTGPWWAPNGSITFKQTLTLGLDVPTQSVFLNAEGDPEVDEPWWFSHDRAVSEVKNARNAALKGASAQLNTRFADARNKLNSGLLSFDKYASASYASLEHTLDGIIVRGNVKASGRINPVVHFEEINSGQAFTALRSWIPGGRITGYVWSWVQMIHPIPWFNKTETIEDEHRFISSRPPGLVNVDKICLRIDGTRLTADGWEEAVSAGETCAVKSHEPFLMVPPWWMKVMVPKWLPRWPDAVLDDMIAAHVNVAGTRRSPGEPTTNTLVHFTGPRVERPLEALSQALSQMARRTMSLVVVVVVPVGTFANRSGEVEASLGAVDERFAADLVITEDYVDGWSQAFSAGDAPSTHLVNARGEFVWKQERRLDVGALSRALDEHIVAAPAPQRIPLRLTVQSGQRAPDALFTDDRGDKIAMRRLRGQRVLLNFWQSWSSPCIRELGRLQRVHSQAGAPFIVAVNGGEDRELLADIRERHNLTFPLIHDADQLIATLYGVQCWPTTVSINEEGIVDRIQFGLTHEHREEQLKAQA